MVDTTTLASIDAQTSAKGTKQVDECSNCKDLKKKLNRRFIQVTGKCNEIKDELKKLNARISDINEDLGTMEIEAESCEPSKKNEMILNIRILSDELKDKEHKVTRMSEVFDTAYAEYMFLRKLLVNNFGMSFTRLVKRGK